MAGAHAWWKRGMMVVLLVGVGGCGKPPASAPTPPPAPGQPPAAKSSASPATRPAASQPEKPATADDLATLRATTKKVKSYQLTMNSGGVDVISWVQLKDGQPVKLKVQTEPNNWSLSDAASNASYLYNAQSKRVFKSSLGGRMPDTAVGKILATLDQQAKVSRVDLDGQACLKAVVGQGDKATTVWLDEEYGLPRQLESGGAAIKLVYQNIDQVPNSEFELPTGLKVVESGKPAAGHGHAAPPTAGGEGK